MCMCAHAQSMYVESRRQVYGVNFHFPTLCGAWTQIVRFVQQLLYLSSHLTRPPCLFLRQIWHSPGLSQTRYEAKDDPELLVFLPPPLQGLDFRSVPPLALSSSLNVFIMKEHWVLPNAFSASTEMIRKESLLLVSSSKIFGAHMSTSILSPPFHLAADRTADSNSAQTDLSHLSV